jgi:hypothetical protein
MVDLVECHSGYEYPQRPRAIYSDGVRHPVKSIIAEWRTPEGKNFRVENLNGDLFELFFDQKSKTWTNTAI